MPNPRPRRTGQGGSVRAVPPPPSPHPPSFDQLLDELATHQQVMAEGIGLLVEENRRLHATLKPQLPIAGCMSPRSYEQCHSGRWKVVRAQFPKGDDGVFIEASAGDIGYSPKRENSSDGSTSTHDYCMLGSSGEQKTSRGSGKLGLTGSSHSSEGVASATVECAVVKHPSMPAWANSKCLESQLFDNAAVMARGFGGTGVYPAWFKPASLDPDEDPVESVLLKQTRLSQIPITSVPCILRPSGTRRLCWDWLWSLVMAYELWIVPIDLVFAYSAATPAGLTTLEWFVMGFFTVDIMLNFITGYVEGDCEVLDRRKIAVKYLSTWFFVDLVATLPWDEFIAGSSRASSSVRAGKAVKIAKVVKMTKLLRVVKIFHHAELLKEAIKKTSVDSIKMQMKLQHTTAKADTLPNVMRSLWMIFNLKFFRHFVLPMQILLVLLLMSHVMAFCRRMLRRGDVPDAKEFDAAVWDYYRNLLWSFSALTFGQTLTEESTLNLNNFLILILWLRVLLVIVLGRIILRKALKTFAEDAGDAVRQRDAIAYLKSHGVSFNTQVQVLHNINESSNIRKMQRNFNDLMDNHLPTELSRALREELWCERLLSLGLIFEISGWRKGFLLDLAQLVHDETFASRVVIFKEGDSAMIAYMVLNGNIIVMDSTDPDEDIPPFTAGMWLGEKALVNPELRRSGTALSETVSSLMALPSSGFFSLLDLHDLKNDYHYFCVNQLWKGLCGRCGSMGDHWSSECPVTGGGPKPKGLMSTGFNTVFAGRRATATMSAGESLKSDEKYFDYAKQSGGKPLARDLVLFIKRYEMEWLEPHLRRLKIFTLDDLLVDDLRDDLINDEKTAFEMHEQRSIDADKINRFKMMVKSESKSMLQTNVAVNNHFFFLSHYKVEAGTEAALMRSELEQLITLTENHPAQRLKVPIFLDSEDLTDLLDLIQAVKKSYNIVIMLTKGILTRPWCLVEIVTAINEGIPCIPVNITKAGFEFEFPDADFYAGLMDGTVLGTAGMDLLRNNGINIADVVVAVELVLKRIAIPYSPHRPLAIRKAELERLLTNAAVRDVRENANNARRLTRSSTKMSGKLLPKSFSKQFGFEKSL